MKNATTGVHTVDVSWNTRDMQVDHVKSVFANTDVSHTMTEEEMYSEKNLLPACRQCNFYKSYGNLESFREALTNTLMKNLQKTFQYRLAIKYLRN